MVKLSLSLKIPPPYEDDGNVGGLNALPNNPIDTFQNILHQTIKTNKQPSLIDR
jgi:hypothetical protein